MFRFMQQVVTPDGTGLFIAPLTDGTRCQVAMWYGKTQKNPIFRLEQVQTATGSKQAYQPRPEPEPALQVENLPLEPAVS